MAGGDPVEAGIAATDATGRITDYDAAEFSWRAAAQDRLTSQRAEHPKAPGRAIQQPACFASVFPVDET
jgi:hypothetical protein